MRWSCFGSPIKKDTLHLENLDGFTSRKKIKLFNYNELARATKNFHPRNKIGRGGFGSVFKGILRSGKPIAVKVLSAWSKQGTTQFLSEIDTITSIKHPNLVELIGCCIEGNQRILVYEFLVNTSLDCALLGKKNRAEFDWSKRSALCIGTATGLTFLHEEVKPHIIHRDIKASNILLGSDFTPKIGDFGLAKLFPDNVTHISTRVAGTIGYLAPEYATGGRLTKKADIYSFGVLILEIISGRSNLRVSYLGIGENLLEQAWDLYQEGRLIELVDPHLKGYPEEEVFKFIKIALCCTQGEARRRPSMPRVLEMLTRSIRFNDKELTPPGILKDPSALKGGTRVTTSSDSQEKGLSCSSSIHHSFASDGESDIFPR